MHLEYKSTQKISKTTDGITSVVLVDNGDTDLGTVVQKSGTRKFDAVMNDITISTHDTKKQAGGALKKRYDGIGTSVKAIVKPQVDLNLRKPQAAPEPAPKPAPMPVPKKPAIPFKPEDWVYKTDDPFEIPPALDRRLK